MALACVVVVEQRPASSGAGELPPALVSFDSLQERLGSPRLRLLDIRSRDDYSRGHLPGAVWVDAKALRAMTSKPGGLENRQAWEAWIAPLGIAPDTEVLITDGERQLDAARLWWVLRYLGVDKAGLINGNVGLWAKEGRPLTSQVPKIEPVAFRVRFRDDRVANRDDVKSALGAGTTRVVDARSAAEYSGEQKSSKRGGHIPTACRLEWSDLVDADGRFLGEPELKSKLAALGLAANQPVITHCQSGGRASVDAFVLERLGFKARNYYAGWSDWGNDPAAPVVTGPAPGDVPTRH
jgi:thiosulfate/3-mercaptopyruvate sulfurtransferase